FPAEGTKQKIRRHREDPPPGVANVPPGFARLLNWLLAKNPTDRPKSAQQVRELLLEWATPPTPQSVGALAVSTPDVSEVDVELWDATPGENIPVPPNSSVLELDSDDSLDFGPVQRSRHTRGFRIGWLLVAVVVGVLALVGVVALLRWL